MPKGIKYFMDPLYVIREYKSCKLHPNTSKLESLSLPSVWEYVKKGIRGAHNSLVDAQAQTHNVIHPLFIYFIDKTKSIRFIAEIFSRKRQKDLQKSMEPEREVHQPWEELFDDSPYWKPYVKSSYDGYDSGGKVGPSNAITQTLRTQKTLCFAFFF